MDTKTIILEYICPFMGMIMANTMFSAPYKDIQKAIIRGQLGDLNPTPWAFMLGNCFGWVTYSYLIQNYWIFFANTQGFILSVWLNMGAAKLQYQDHRSKEMKQSFVNYLMEQQQQQLVGLETEEQCPMNNAQRTVSTKIGDDKSEPAVATYDNNNNNNDDDDKDCENHYVNTVAARHLPPKQTKDVITIVWDITSQTSPAPAPHESVVLGIVVVWLACISVIAFGTSFTDQTRELIVGLLVNLNLVFFYGAPLSTIATVLKTQNSASIHIWTMMTNTANGTFWTAYGLAILDPFVYIPNGLGALLGVVQMVLCVTFPRFPLLQQEGDDNDDHDSPPEKERSHPVDPTATTTILLQQPSVSLAMDEITTTTVAPTEIHIMEETTREEVMEFTTDSDTSPELPSEEELELEENV